MESTVTDVNVKELTIKRSNIKGRITKFKNYLDSLQRQENIPELGVNELMMKLSRIEALFMVFDELQLQIESSNSSNLESELAIRDAIEQDFDHNISLAKIIIKSNSSSNHSDYHTNASTQAQDNIVGFKLPIIKIPTFDGAYYKWLEFKETFCSLIHDNDKINNIHKFHYLNSYLEGEASRVICNLEVSCKNYSQAWQLLCERYDNKRQLINNHLKSLFNFETTRETDKSLRFIIDHITKNLRALSTLGLPTDKWDILIIYMVTAKLDNSTYFKWEEHRNSLPEIPSISDFFTFLKNRADVLEVVHRNKQDKPKSLVPVSQNNKQQSHVKSFLTTTKTAKIFECIFCKGNHRLYECNLFKSKTPDDRISFVKSQSLCENCLRPGHNPSACRLPGTCRLCKRRHNSLLHLEIGLPQTSDPTSQAHVMAALVPSSQVLLCTAIVKICNPNTNTIITARALLDCGSQLSFITESVMHKLNLPPQPSNVNILGIGGSPLNSNMQRCFLRLKSNVSAYSVDMTCLVLPKISDSMPRETFEAKLLNLPNFSLADPEFNKPSPIDMLIGADLFWDLISSEQHSLGPKMPVLRNSKLGWLIAGPLAMAPCQQFLNSAVVCHALIADPNCLENQVAKFWELENFPQASPYTLEERLCEQHFLSTYTRLSDGRFCVRLPLRDNRDCLGDSYQIAKKRFLNLEARFRKQPELKRAYSEFINEYRHLGHLSDFHMPNNKILYFLPHHPVLREKGESTKLRVVFDASARTTSGLSVNNLQMVGPTIQDSLFNILLRFRTYKYILSGDIEKMYRQINVDKTDRDLQLILWRENETDELSVFQLNTVTYGFASASFLSTRCIWQLGEECSDQNLKTIIQKDFYCDDLLTGSDSEDELRIIQRRVTSELAKGCFHLRKFRSNLPHLLDSNNTNVEKGNLIISNATSTLGIGWSPLLDEIHFPIELTLPKTLTKRSILSVISKIFDPLGLLSLYTITFKIFLQQLWTYKLDWDEALPSDLNTIWLNLTKTITNLNEFKIPRRVLIDDAKTIEMHCFCDASERAYGSCVFIKSVNQNGDVLVRLFCAKARVTPLKATTIPRLELCAAVLGAQLSSFATSAIRCHITRHFFWTDSRIVLGWINSPNKAKTFVANRIAAIHELSDPASWRYVPTAENPADLASRGVDSLDSNKTSLWWHGPAFIGQTEASWPTFECISVELPELKAITALAAEVMSLSIIDFKRFSKLIKVQRIIATIYRFIYNCSHPQDKITGNFRVDELTKAMYTILKITQIETFPEERYKLISKKPLRAKCMLLSLNPFVDEMGLIRVGGRIDNSNHPYDKKHPILLCSKHHITKLIFSNEHERLLHAGPQQLLASIRDQYWPIGGRSLARATARNCSTCRRFKGRTLTNIMGNLPSQRIQPDYPFSAVATDFAGPFFISDRKGRGCKITRKCYLCIFVCLRFRCIHLEAVSELSKNAFILTLKRFIARRGVPNLIYCDNGRNFVAAAKEMSDFLRSNKDSICDFASRQNIEFKFSPAYAPHFNGSAEAGVKSAKFHVRRVLGNSHLTFEELSTLFSQIEAILNSRPLCPLSPSPNDFQPLTPGHFLIGKPLTSPPSKNLLNYDESRLDRFQFLEKMRQHFWQRWTNEYVSELQQRTKWRTKCRELKLDDLVLLKDDALPPLCWHLGRVTKLFPGSDGVPRVADIATSKGTIRRAINRICLLPTMEEESS